MLPTRPHTQWALSPTARRTDGVLVIDKARGPTSHDVVSRVRRSLGVREVGHAGTLDPMATGVLVLALGEATKLVPWLTAHEKTYRATIALGVETETLDAEGIEVRRCELSGSLRAALASFAASKSVVPPPLLAALAAERARDSQVPPAFSAIRKGGERAYVLARRGQAVELSARAVAVRRLELEACREEPPCVDVVLDVAKGYYVRSFARDFAAALGTIGHLVSLRRTRSGCFGLDEASSVDEAPDALGARILSLVSVAARALPSARLSAVGARDAWHGRPVQPVDMDIDIGADTEAPGGATSGPMAWFDDRGELVAIGSVDATGHGKVLRGIVRAREPEVG